MRCSLGFRLFFHGNDNPASSMCCFEFGKLTNAMDVRNNKKILIIVLMLSAPLFCSNRLRIPQRCPLRRSWGKMTLRGANTMWAYWCGVRHVVYHPNQKGHKHRYLRIQCKVFPRVNFRHLALSEVSGERLSNHLQHALVKCGRRRR